MTKIYVPGFVNVLKEKKKSLVKLLSVSFGDNHSITRLISVSTMLSSDSTIKTQQKSVCFDLYSQPPVKVTFTTKPNLSHFICTLILLLTD